MWDGLVLQPESSLFRFSRRLGFINFQLKLMPLSSGHLRNNFLKCHPRSSHPCLLPINQYPIASYMEQANRHTWTNTLNKWKIINLHKKILSAPARIDVVVNVNEMRVSRLFISLLRLFLMNNETRANVKRVERKVKVEPLLDIFERHNHSRHYWYEELERVQDWRTKGNFLFIAEFQHRLAFGFCFRHKNKSLACFRGWAH